jgi:hypothetical protein
VWEELLFANNINPTGPMDTLGAFSYIVAKEGVPGCDNLECLLIKTIGVKNITPSSDLIDVPLPREFFLPVPSSKSSYEKLCKAHGIGLSGNIVCEAFRRVYRPKGEL